MYQSNEFGRLFWVDDELELRSCPMYLDGTGDFENDDYVSEWTDLEGVDISKLLEIHKFCILNKINHGGSLVHKEQEIIHYKRES